MKTIFAIIFCATALWISAAHAELSLKLNSSTGGHYLLAEPISIGITLTNDGPEPTQIMKDLGPEFETVKYFIKHPDGQEILFTPWAIKEPAEPLATLSPGESVADSAKLFFDGSNWIFTQPGKYEIRAVYAGSVKSEPLKIEVAAPSDAKEKKVAEALLASDESGLFLLLGGGDHLVEGVKVLQRISETAPGTPYAVHADLALGLSLVRPFADFKTKTVRQADPARASQLLERVDLKRLSLTSAATARLALAQAYRAQNDPERAKVVEKELPAQLEMLFPQATPNIREQLLPKIERSLQ